MLEEDAFTAPFGGVLYSLAGAVMPIFVVPAVLVLLAVLVQRAFVVTPSKLQPKLSRISLLQNIKNKFGRAGLFEFFKSFLKLTIYATCMGFFLNAHLNDIVSVVRGEAIQALDLLGRLILQMMLVVIIVSMLIGALDAMFQQQEHIRKNMMSRKEMMDELKESEGDPHLKQERRARAQSIATAQMMAEVPRSDVLIVNPTHYAVALRWDRAPGSAPICVAKGVDALALRMREVAQESAVPIHSDPPTARVLHASVDIGQEVAPDHYEAVAAAIRFADQMRERAKGAV
jgi:flagellar biosynthetic protein FlhB